MDDFSVGQKMYTLEWEERYISKVGSKWVYVDAEAYVRVADGILRYGTGTEYLFTEDALLLELAARRICTRLANVVAKFKNRSIKSMYLAELKDHVEDIGILGESL
jgi:hypothetical protein